VHECVSASITADGLEIARLHDVKGSVFADSSPFHPKCSRAESGEHWVVVTRCNDDSAASNNRLRALLKELPKLVIERLVHFVE
jgi:hypothetical protein